VRITTVYPGDSYGPGFLAWFVRSTIEGIAVGAYPAFPSWGLPSLYTSGVYFALPPKHGTGEEEFNLPPETYRRGFGDCDQLTIWRLLECWHNARIHPLKLLELMATNRAARCRCVWDGNQFHVLIRHPSGVLEDPAKRLTPQ